MDNTVLSQSSPRKEVISKLYSYSSADTKQQQSSSPIPSPTNIEINGNGDLANATTLMEIGSVARILSDDFIHYKLGKCSSRPPSKEAETLRRVGKEVEERYEISLNGLVNSLRFDPENGGEEAFNESLNAMFEEGPCNWGRIVMVYVFAARLAKYCEDQHKSEYVDDLVSISGKYVDERLTPWIQKQGGWEDFNENFKAKDWKEKVAFNSLLVTGALLGGLAALRFFATK
ncbi:apoptosis regulator BAX-like [Amphiura filiformis]|uniref:apoptosis regulator BAX-like n=1 Tax=Amphiura filiformis TaxID=82378 RepID=UPI003B210BF4